MQYQPYPEYRNSGIEWLGDIPNHWDVISAKLCYEIQLGKMLQNNAESITDREVSYLKALHVTWAGVKTDELPTMWASPNDLEKYTVNDGDLLICEGGEVGRASILKKDTDETWVIQNALHRVRGSELSNVEYFNYLLRHIADSGWFDILCNKATIAHLTGEKLGALKVSVPDVPEQQTIARFLDYKTQQIDQLIAKKQTLIDKLNEQRIALITHAVTKGLNPDVEMKDSGVEWLGDVPKHWDVRRLKFVTESFGGGTPNTAIDLYWNGDIPWVSPKDMKSRKITQTQDNITQLGLEESTSRMINENTVLIVVRSGILRHSIPVAINLVPVSINQDMKALVPNESLLSPHYLQFFIEGNQKDLLDAWSKQGCTVESIESDYMLNSVMVLPPVEEQTQIVEYLDGKMARIDRMIELNQQTIDKLKEYRTALITAAVTGKIDVRKWQEEANHATP